MNRAHKIEYDPVLSVKKRIVEYRQALESLERARDDCRHLLVSTLELNSLCLAVRRDLEKYEREAIALRTP